MARHFEQRAEQSEQEDASAFKVCQQNEKRQWAGLPTAEAQRIWIRRTEKLKPGVHSFEARNDALLSEKVNSNVALPPGATVTVFSRAIGCE